MLIWPTHQECAVMISCVCCYIHFVFPSELCSQSAKETQHDTVADGIRQQEVLSTDHFLSVHSLRIGVLRPPARLQQNSQGPRFTSPTLASDDEVEEFCDRRESTIFLKLTYTIVMSVSDFNDKLGRGEKARER